MNYFIFKYYYLYGKVYEKSIYNNIFIKAQVYNNIFKKSTCPPISNRIPKRCTSIMITVGNSN